MYKYLIIFLFLCGCAVPSIVYMEYKGKNVKIHTYNISKCPPNVTGCAITGDNPEIYLMLGLDDTRTLCHELAHIEGMRHDAWVIVQWLQCTTVTVKSNSAVCGENYPVGKYICF